MAVAEPPHPLRQTLPIRADDRRSGADIGTVESAT